MKYGKPAPGEVDRQYSDQTFGHIVLESILVAIIWFLLLAAVIIAARMLPPDW